MGYRSKQSSRTVTGSPDGNRKIAVPRHVLKESLELFWVSLFRFRKLAVRALGYDPLMLNFDQSPYHHNESGSQNKATLGVRGSTVPVVEGNCDVRSRWTANLTTCSSVTAVAAGFVPPVEFMFKGTRDGKVHKRLTEHRRRRGFPSWITVNTSEKEAVVNMMESKNHRCYWRRCDMARLCPRCHTKSAWT